MSNDNVPRLARSWLSKSIIWAAFQSCSIISHAIWVNTTALIIYNRVLLSKTCFSVKTFWISPTIFIAFAIVLNISYITLSVIIGTLSGHCQGNSGTIPGQCPDNVETISGQFRDNFGTMSGQCRDTSRTMSRQCQDNIVSVVRCESYGMNHTVWLISLWYEKLTPWMHAL